MIFQVVNVSAIAYRNIGNHYCAEMRTAKHHVSVIVSAREVRVVVHNAANRVWKGLGKGFRDVAAALANYKTVEVREMIKWAVDAAAVATYEAPVQS